MDEIPFDLAVIAARRIIALEACETETGRALRFGRITFIVLDAIRASERRPGGEHTGRESHVHLALPLPW